MKTLHEAIFLGMVCSRSQPATTKESDQSLKQGSMYVHKRIRYGTEKGVIKLEVRNDVRGVIELNYATVSSRSCAGSVDTTETVFIDPVASQSALDLRHPRKLPSPSRVSPDIQSLSAQAHLSRINHDSQSPSSRERTQSNPSRVSIDIQSIWARGDAETEKDMSSSFHEG